jgi:hypothetical protein
MRGAFWESSNFTGLWLLGNFRLKMCYTFLPYEGTEGSIGTLVNLATE